jgi:hypothetical protein
MLPAALGILDRERVEQPSMNGFDQDARPTDVADRYRTGDHGGHAQVHSDPRDKG